MNFLEALQHGHYPIVLSTIIFSFVRALRLEHIQSWLPKKMRWETWPAWLKNVVIFLASSIGGIAAVATDKLDASQAIETVVSVALGAMGLNATANVYMKKEEGPHTLSIDVIKKKEN